MSRVLIVLLLAAILLAVTNPTAADFQVYVHSEVTARTGGYGSLESAALGWFAGNVAAFTVERRDYVVASVFLVRMNGKVYPWIGVLKNFFPLAPHS